MKLMILLLLIPSIGVAQTQSIPPKANTIIVYGVTFQEVCSRLLDSGYVIEKKDNDLQTVSTQAREYRKKYNAGYVIHARVKDSTTVMYTTYSLPFSKPLLVNLAGNDPILKDQRGYNETDKRGRTKENSLDAMPFFWMNSLAQSFGKPVEYIIQ